MSDDLERYIAEQGPEFAALVEQAERNLDVVHRPDWEWSGSKLVMVGCKGCGDRFGGGWDERWDEHLADNGIDPT